jgi:glucan 1,3-beta-glucosidase
MTDLVFNGGNYGAFLGNQQFTTRNMTFNNCRTAIYMNWNWLWTLKSVNVNNCDVGIDMTSGGSSGGNQSVGSIVLIDSMMTSTPTGILTAFGSNSIPETGGTLVIDNVDFTGTNMAVAGLDGTQILAGGSVVDSWAQGSAYRPSSPTRKMKRVPQVPSTSADTCSSTQVPPISMSSGLSNISSSTTSSSLPAMTSAANISSVCTSSAMPVSSSRIQQQLTAPTKPPSLLDGSKKIFERSKPQYENVPASSFVSVKSQGAKGDGVTDDTAAIQAVFNNATPDQVVYFDHGAYVITGTVNVPKNIRITGEIWPLIMAGGSFFSDQTNPQPVFRVGMPGDRGAVEISDLIFETLGPRPGAIMMEWNVADSTQGACGLWDVHFRVGGTAGTQLQQDKCLGNSTSTTTQGIPSAQFVPECAGSFLMLHITQQATAYVENVWLWVADHELDMAMHSEVNIYNGRGMLVESKGPVWLYGTSVEHSQLYNYQIANAKDIFMGAIQTETAYMQPAPDALNGGFTPNPAYSDPDFAACTTESCKKTWGLRIVDSSDVYMYAGGLYSFFDNYQQQCLGTTSCQDNMVDIECSSNVMLYGLTTKATVNMVTVNGQSEALGSDNVNGFGSTLALFEQ